MVSPCSQAELESLHARLDIHLVYHSMCISVSYFNVSFLISKLCILCLYYGSVWKMLSSQIEEARIHFCSPFLFTLSSFTGFLAGISMFFYRSTSISMYLFSKLVEVSTCVSLACVLLHCMGGLYSTKSTVPSVGLNTSVYCVCKGLMTCCLQQPCCSRNSVTIKTECC